MKFENKKDLYDGLEMFISVVRSIKIMNNKTWMIDYEDIAKRFECDTKDVEIVANNLGIN